MDYRYEEFKYLATPDGFNYPIDVYNGAIYLGTLQVKPDGVIIGLVDTPKGKVKISPSPSNKFKTQQIAAQVLHRTWQTYRHGGEDLGNPVPAIAEIALAKQKPNPSPTEIQGPHLFIPDYENEGDKYPGDVKPGYYDPRQLVILLLYHLDNPNALQFIADMMEVGDDNQDVFVRWLRKNKNNPRALQKAAADWKNHL